MILTYRALTTLGNMYVTNASGSVFATRRLRCKKKKLGLNPRFKPKREIFIYNFRLTGKGNSLSDQDEQILELYIIKGKLQQLMQSNLKQVFFL